MNRYLFNDITFENFIVGNSNKLAYSISVEVSKLSDDILYPVYICGPSGCGKTHLLMAIANEINKSNPDFNIKYVTAEQFVNELINAINNNETQKFRKEYIEADLLLFEDFQFLKLKETSQEEAFFAFEALRNLNRPIVVTGNIQLSEGMFDERIKNLICGGMVINIQKLDKELKSKILKAWSNEIKNVEHEKLEKVINLLSLIDFNSIVELKGAFNTAISGIKLSGFDCSIKNIDDIYIKNHEID